MAIMRLPQAHPLRGIRVIVDGIWRLKMFIYA